MCEKVHMEHLRISVISLTLILTVGSSGCLKTRSQLKDDSDPEPVPSKVEPVQTQGGYAVDEIKQEMTRLTGRIEDLEHAKNADAPKRDEQLKELENRVHELEQAQMAALEAIKKIQAEMPLPDQVELYQKAKDDFKNKNYDETIQSLNQYLKNSNGKFYEDGVFLRGESYYAQKNYKKAIVDYSKFPEKMTHSPYMPKALLKIGRSFEAMGSKEDAAAFYQQLIDDYPKSSEAKEAKKRITRKKAK
jgi:tol-pal system protein YbgF